MPYLHAGEAVFGPCVCHESGQGISRGALAYAAWRDPCKQPLEGSNHRIEAPMHLQSTGGTRDHFQGRRWYG